MSSEVPPPSQGGYTCSTLELQMRRHLLVALCFMAPWSTGAAVTPKTGAAYELRVKGVTYSMASIAAGSFTMGSPDGETDRGSDEKQH